MSDEKGYIWRGGLILGKDESGQIKVCSGTVDRSIEHVLSGRCLVISCPGESGGMVGVNDAEHNQIFVLFCILPGAIIAITAERLQ